MSDSTANQYLLKALDNYPRELEQSLEALQYSLSYDDQSAQANYLMGKFCMEQFKQFDEAAYYFDKALSCDLYFLDTYEEYSQLKMYIGAYEEALKLIEFALKQKGALKCVFTVLKSNVYEYKTDYDESLKWLKEARRYSYNPTYDTYLEKEITRVKKKRKKLKMEEKKSTPKKKKKKKSSNIKGEALRKGFFLKIFKFLIRILL